jgi:hypothetical protein
MNRNIYAVAFLLGAMAVVWVGVGYIGSNTLALTVTAVIGAAYLFGTRELLEFWRATSTLAAALAAIPDRLTDLDDWLLGVHPSLRSLVRLRIEGERVGLPGPALTPYLVGLLVMLGMLGTFLGMVVTLNGAGFALEGGSDAQAIRSALAAPIRGLGVAFGTSVAGVAASAMLGLISALCRRERLAAAQLLDSRIATDLRGFSLAYQRQEAFNAMQRQAQALPEVADKLQAMIEQMTRRETQLAERLLGNQQDFHREVGVVYSKLAGAVEQSLKDSLAQGARLAGETLKPAIELALSGIASEAAALQRQTVESTQRQLDGLAARFDASAERAAQNWEAAQASQQRTGEKLIDGLERSLVQFNAAFAQSSAALQASLGEAFSSAQARQLAGDQQRLDAWQRALAATAQTLQSEWRQAGEQTFAGQRRVCATLETTARDIAEHAQASAGQTIAETTRLLHCAEELVSSRSAAEAQWAQQHGERMAELITACRAELSALRDQEAARGDAAADRLGELQAALAEHLTTLGAALEAPMARLIETASEAPRAAAEVIAQLRGEMSTISAHDNELLAERSRIMATLSSLLAAINHAAGEQRSAIDALVSAAAQLLERTGQRYAEQVGAESAQLAEIAAQVTGGAVEVASLSEAFGFAVERFNEGNEKLLAGLQKIEASLEKSSARSDEQLAYYVAQAREIIDLSLMSQKEIVDGLRQVGKPALAAQEV